MKFFILTIIFITILISDCFSQNDSYGKLIITGFKGTSPSDSSVQQLKNTIDKGKIGGIILYKRNIISRNQLTQLIDFLTENTPIFISIDHEGGLVDRLQHPSFNLNSPNAETFCKWPISRQYKTAELVSSTLSSIGINLNFGGVADMSPIITDSSVCNSKRCFSNEIDSIISCNHIYIDSHKKALITYAIKHYPGHGSTPIDSHYNLPDITQHHSNEEYMPYFKLAPYIKMIMTGHLLDRRVDSKYPASLSRSHLHYLRNTIGFKGLIITDDLNMAALNHFFNNKSDLSIHALNAGNNLLLFEYLSIESIDSINSAIYSKSKRNPIFYNHLHDSLAMSQKLLNVQ